MCQSVISRRLTSLNITRKRLSLVPQERNAPQVIEERLKYAMSLKQNDRNELIYLDGIGFNLHTSKHYGYSLINTQAYRVVPANRGRNISLLCALSHRGLVSYELSEGPYNAAKFAGFLTEKLFPALPHRKVIVMDNARFHHAKAVKILFQNSPHTLRFLPAYSPN